METDRRKFLKSIAGLSGLAASAVSGTSLAKSSAGVSSTQVQDIRLSKNKGYVRLVFDLDGIADHSVFALHKPERVVLDIKSTKMPHGMVDQVQANSLIRSIRSGVQNKNDLRVVFDLSKSVTARSFLLAPSGKSGHRLVIDLHDDKKQPGKSSTVKKSHKRDVIIAIDAGHGGKDPGATGRSGTHEKIVTLQIAKRLEKV